MTVKAEFLDQRGIDIYGTREVVLHPQPKAFALYDETKVHVDPAAAWGLVVIPESFNLSDSDQLKSVRWQLVVAGRNQVEVTRYTPSDDGRSQLARTELYEGPDIDNINVLNSRVSLPGIRPGEQIPARVRWEKDIPIISRIRESLREYRRFLRLEDARDALAK